jgi:hypothetical protein
MFFSGKGKSIRQLLDTSLSNQKQSFLRRIDSLRKASSSSGTGALGPETTSSPGSHIGPKTPEEKKGYANAAFFFFFENDFFILFPFTEFVLCYATFVSLDVFVNHNFLTTLRRSWLHLPRFGKDKDKEKQPPHDPNFVRVRPYTPRSTSSNPCLLLPASFSFSFFICISLSFSGPVV